MSSDRAGAVPDDTGAVRTVGGDSETAQCEVRTCGYKSDNDNAQCGGFDAQHQKQHLEHRLFLGREFYAPDPLTTEPCFSALFLSILCHTH